MRFLFALISVTAIGCLVGCDEVEEKMLQPAQAQQLHFAKVRTAMLDDPNVRQVVRSQCMADAARQGVAKGSRNAKGRYCDGVIRGIMSGKLSYRNQAAASATRVTPSLRNVLPGV
ncbi:hypothetical protein F8A10_07605 [Paracoccus kondratievae]|uniref:hypothetical protein n=1 Tax=Paracoccus kondratievae TaxID=135740 RepID=UPI0012662137|nr:hypothetical protein [Paracoccus kondratievae]QFQ87299.1 hypothetical protein F8A10_07605 [Paracoccus kondratievae]